MCSHAADSPVASMQTAEKIRIFLAEDNPADSRLVEESLKLTGLPFELTVHTDGEQAIQAMQRIDESNAPRPHVVLLDLNLPRRDGFQILSSIRSSRRCHDVPVAMLTSSNLRRDRDRAAQLGANEYLHKSIDLDVFLTGLSEMLQKLSIQYVHSDQGTMVACAG